MEAAPAEAGLYAVVGGGIVAVKERVLQAKPEPWATDGQQERLTAARTAAMALREAVTAADASLRFLMAQGGPVDWFYAHAIVACCAGPGDVPAAGARLPFLLPQLRGVVDRALQRWYARPQWESAPEVGEDHLATLEALVEGCNDMVHVLPVGEQVAREIAVRGEKSEEKVAPLLSFLQREHSHAGDYQLVPGGYYPVIPACHTMAVLIQEAMK
jgi:hypothetical protein